MESYLYILHHDELLMVNILYFLYI